MRKLPGEWLILQPHSNDKHGNKCSNYIWEASLVEASLKSYIELWGQCNKDAHSLEAHIHLAKEQASKATRKLYKLWHHARFRDSVLFPTNIEQFIEMSTAQKLQRCVLITAERSPCRKFSCWIHKIHHKFVPSGLRTNQRNIATTSAG